HARGGNILNERARQSSKKASPSQPALLFSFVEVMVGLLLFLPEIVGQPVLKTEQRNERQQGQSCPDKA
ncbi:hypothetical protein KC221_27815, partial [Mycobacterium tuberculosis]|nr:hypothetical protein [Mycobacterium tuberculosis]